MGVATLRRVEERRPRRSNGESPRAKPSPSSSKEASPIPPRRAASHPNSFKQAQAADPTSTARLAAPIIRSTPVSRGR